ncbi:ribitol-5-phosphate xylosyltransferase 1-like isoform X1 [Palaemon carinicauda]|uniref:ribitol-5-phosphate xylosyltransferase 1-like isoform X1 n=2 Tax=Palaemon carinicauda TaxID=392227 RepID=UPI0035B57459
MQRRSQPQPSKSKSPNKMTGKRKRSLSPSFVNDMTKGPYYILRRVLVGVCFIQVIITGFLAICIFNSAFSSVRGIESLPEIKAKTSTGKQKIKVQEGQVIDFDIGENEAAIVLSQHEVKPNRLEVKWDEGGSNGGVAVTLPVVEMWSKAAIGTYLWQHILEGEESLDELIPGATIGELSMPAFVLRYRSGPGIVPETVPHDVTHLVLVVNGRTEEKIGHAKVWLDDLVTWDKPPVIILLMLGNEKCENRWIDQYMVPKGPVTSVLLTYDDPRVDQVTFHQWPLGVATYRQFPVIEEEKISPEAPRKYMCNLRATLHPNSSRIALHNFLKNDYFASSNCFISVRENWLPNETPESMKDYVESLLQSDLTLCPAGMNTETYRVYEALSAGSTPVIEDVTTPGSCDAKPWRLLKKHGPPVIWVKSWEQLPKILAKEKRYSKQYKALRRLRVSQWYEWFKLKMRDRFISIVTSLLLRPA